MEFCDVGGDGDDYPNHLGQDFIDLESGSGSDGQEPLTGGALPVRLASRREITLWEPGQGRM